MKIIQSVLSKDLIHYPLENIGSLDNLLFFDIETTGFSHQTTSLYLIGVVYYREGEWKSLQWLSEQYENPAEEKELLTAFIEFSKPYQTFIHFNGNTFDIPYLSGKFHSANLDNPFSNKDGIDLYQRTAPYKQLLQLPNCKQKTLEAVMHFPRKDEKTPKELIQLFIEYSSHPTTELEDLLLLHNLDDLKGMLHILPILSYSDLLLQKFRVVKVYSNQYLNEANEESSELIMKIKLFSALPIEISVNSNGCYLSSDANVLHIKLPIIKKTLKYFYSNYKDYYYLPNEDTALHKSVAGFLDPSLREKATAKNCYTLKEAVFLPQWDIVFSPIFKDNYEDNCFYFELEDEMKKSPELFQKYALHILDMLLHTKNK